MKASAGSLGPRLAGRLTAELILRSKQYMSDIGYYSLDLRGLKARVMAAGAASGQRIGAIENLGATENQFDCIDLSDNALIRIEGFAKLPRLKMLLCCNNRISSIATGLQDTIPNLEFLILTNNKIERLTDLDPLATCKALRYLSLLENGVSKNKDYRLYAIYKIPSLKVLDFKKVKQAERDAAKAKYEGLTDAQVRDAAAAQPLVLVQPAEGDGAASANAEQAAAEPAAPTAAQLTAIKAAIANAQTLAEVQQLEAALKSGRVPEGILEAEAEDGATAMDE